MGFRAQFLYLNRIMKMPNEPNPPIEDLFTSGAYTTVAMEGGPDQWQTYAAMGFIGKCREAIEGLSRFNHSEARFHLGAAHWIDGNEAEAIQILKEIHTPHAQNLLTLIRKPQIHVLAQLPWTRQAPHDLLTAAIHDNKFKIENISFHPDDLKNEPYADIHKYYDPQRPPDFYICQMVEWHSIAPNLQQMSCPLFGATADYDVHIQTVYPWLRVFDELLVAAQKEWREVRGLTRIPVATFPKLYGIADSLPPIVTGPREIDLFLSGTVTHPYHPEKARLLDEILQMPDLKVRFINGFIGPKAYQTLLGHSKVSFTYVRHPDGMVTRGLEALSMGCAVVVQRGSVLNLYVGEKEGVLPYDFRTKGLAPAIRRILEDWPEFERRARKGAEVIRREFALSRVASQYLRFLTFLAAKPRGKRQIQPMERLDQKRSILQKGWLPAGLDTLKKMRKSNLGRWEAKLEKESDSKLLINIARELMLEYAQKHSDETNLSENKIFIKHILDFYRNGLLIFPRSLVLRFNLIRTVFHFGQDTDIEEGLQIAGETLNMPESGWEIDVMDDVFPWDFSSTFFNYRQYFDLVTKHLMQGMPVHEDLVRLILASLHYYVGRYLEDLGHLKAAQTLDPEFPFYKYYYAQQLVKRGEAGDDQEGGDLLTQLAEESILFAEAFELLEQLQGQQRFTTSNFYTLAHKVGQAQKSGFIMEKWRFETLRPTARLSSLGLPTEPPSQVQSGLHHDLSKPVVPTKNYLVSALVSSYNAERFMRGLLENLESQSNADKLEIVIIDSNSSQNDGAIVREFQKHYDNIVYVRTEKRENYFDSLNRAIQLSHGKYLTIADTDNRLRLDALEQMGKVLERRPEIALVYGDVAVTKKENEEFGSPDITGYFRWPEFNRRLLFQACYIGPQPMWRKNLHEHYGYFDSHFYPVANYEFWLKIAQTEKFFHIPEVLGLYLLSPNGHAQKDPALTHSESERARKKHWPPVWGERPSPRDGFFIPIRLLPSTWASESQSLFEWRIISSYDLVEIKLMESLVKNAMFRQDWIVAETVLRTSMERFPFFLGAYLTLDELLMTQGRIREAEEILEAALKMNPFTLELLKRLGMNRYAQDHPVEAGKTFSQALALSPHDPDVLVSLGKIYLESGRYEEAIRYFESTLQKNPKDVDACIGLTLAAKRINDQTTFIKAYQKARTLDPHHPMVVQLAAYFNQKKSTFPGGKVKVRNHVGPSTLIKEKR